MPEPTSNIEIGAYEVNAYVAKVRGGAQEAGYPGAAARAGRHEPSNENLRFATATRHRRTVMTRKLEHFKATGLPTLNSWEEA